MMRFKYSHLSVFSLCFHVMSSMVEMLHSFAHANMRQWKAFVIFGTDNTWSAVTSLFQEPNVHVSLYPIFHKCFRVC